MLSANLNEFIPSALLIYKELAELGAPFLCFEGNNQWALRSGIDNSYFNFLLVKNPDSFLFNNAIKFFNACPFECTFDKTNLLLTQKCEKWGLTFGEDSWRMVLDLSDFYINHPTNLSISVRQVSSEMDIRHWINVIALGFRLSRSYIKDFFYPVFKASHRKFRFSLCLLNDIPAAASLLFLDPPYSTIFSLATRPQFRKQGLAHYLLQEEFANAKTMHITKCAVQATALGKPLYKKLGFQETQELTTYIFDPSKMVES